MKPMRIRALQSRDQRSQQSPSSSSVHAKLLYTPEDAAELLSISRSRIYILMANADIVSIKEGRSRLIPATALDAYLQRRLIEQAPFFSTVEPLRLERKA